MTFCVDVNILRFRVLVKIEKTIFTVTRIFVCFNRFIMERYYEKLKSDEIFRKTVNL